MYCCMQSVERERDEASDPEILRERRLRRWLLYSICSQLYNCKGGGWLLVAMASISYSSAHKGNSEGVWLATLFPL